MDRYETCKKCGHRLAKWNEKLKAFVCPKCNHLFKPKPYEQANLKRSMYIFPGIPVIIYDSVKNKLVTGEVIKRYGQLAKGVESLVFGPYCDLIDVKLKGGRISRGHFTSGVHFNKKEIVGHEN